MTHLEDSRHAGGRQGWPEERGGTRASLRPAAARRACTQTQAVLEAERLDLVLPVRDVHDGHVGVVCEERERVQQPVLVVPGEAVRRLVEQQQPRLLGERTAQQYELLLTVREVEEVLRACACIWSQPGCTRLQPPAQRAATSQCDGVDADLHARGACGGS